MTTIATGSTVIIDAGYTTRIAPVNVGGELNVAGEINLTNGAADGSGLATGASGRPSVSATVARQRASSRPSGRRSR